MTGSVDAVPGVGWHAPRAMTIHGQMEFTERPPGSGDVDCSSAEARGRRCNPSGISGFCSWDKFFERLCSMCKTEPGR